jgi:low affinity Fe/Cu permease
VTSAALGSEYNMYTILLIILVLLLIGALPTWPYSNGWGYYPSGGLGLVLIIVLVLVLMGRV